MPIPSSTKVLVIDDFRYMGRMLRGLLGQIGISQVDEVGDGIEALDKLKRGDYGLVICDLVLNCPDGLDVLREVREDAALSGLPFVIYTLDRSPGTWSRILSAGASACLHKPFGAHALRTALETAFQAHAKGAPQEPAETLFQGSQCAAEVVLPPPPRQGSQHAAVAT